MNTNEALDKIVNGVENNARDINKIYDDLIELKSRLVRLEARPAVTIGRGATLPPEVLDVDQQHSPSRTVTHSSSHPPDRPSVPGLPSS